MNQQDTQKRFLFALMAAIAAGLIYALIAKEPGGDYRAISTYLGVLSLIAVASSFYLLSKRTSHDESENAEREAIIEAILAERQRQIVEEGKTELIDDAYTNGELANAAASYAVVEKTPELWPFDEKSYKKGKHGRIRQLVIAGAFIVAEIERQQRNEMLPLFRPANNQK